MQAISNNNLWNSYPAMTIKHGVIGVLAGTVDIFFKSRIKNLCASSESLLCLPTSSFFDPEKLKVFFFPIQEVTAAIHLIFKSFIPTIPLTASNCEQLLNWDKTLKMFPNNPNINFSKHLVATCCDESKKFVFNGSFFLSGALVEEIFARVILQKIAIPYVAKLLPERIGKPLATAPSRILISSIFFALVHTEAPKVLNHFVCDALYGIVAERYGIFASTIAHFMANVHTAHLYRDFCHGEIAGFVNFLSGKK